MNLQTTIDIDLIDTTERMRKDYGKINELAASIKEFGLIQPIVLTLETDHERFKAKLLAGGRRLAALKGLGYKVLAHNLPERPGQFIWSHEQDTYNLRSIELEENLRRKELTWQEEVEGKRLLLELMQQKHGVPKVGQPLSNDATRGGFGTVKLAAMLGETPRQTAKDLKVAAMMKVAPHLAKAPTKESAYRTLHTLVQVGQMQIAGQAAAKAQAASGVVKPVLWTLYEGDFKQNVHQILDASVDLVYTDLPFGVGLTSQSNHSNGVVGYDDTRKGIVDALPELLQQSHRVLRVNRYAVFFFGFNYYTELCRELEGTGFEYNPVPVIWYRRVGSCENPNSRYANAYDPAIVAWKGTPMFMRPGQLNVVEIPALAAGTKLQIAQQPEALPLKFIEDMTAPGALVVDFCAGSGTTGVAAVKAKRRVVMFEREEAACQIIKARMGVL
jgi:DNA modification methylase